MFPSTQSVLSCRQGILTHQRCLVSEEVSAAAADSPTAAGSHTTAVNSVEEITITKPKELLPHGRTLPVASEAEAELGVEAVEDSALVRYTSASVSRLVSPTNSGISIPQEIQRSFTLLARYYTSPNTPSPTPIAASLLAFLDNFITDRIAPTSFHTVTTHNLSAIEDQLLIDTIRWARSEGIPFTARRPSEQGPSVHPVHQAQGLSIQPVHQAQRLSIRGPSVHPVHQARGLSIQPVHQAQQLSIPPAQQTAHRRLQIEYELPAGISAVPGSPGTVLIPIQVENSSKKRKVRLQLVRPRLDQQQLIRPMEHTARSRSGATSTEASLDLPDAPDTMSGSGRMLKRREYSPAGSLSEYEDEILVAGQPLEPLTIEEARSEIALGKQREVSHLARHGYRQPSVIPESEDDDAMEGIRHAIEEPPSSPMARPGGRRQSPEKPPAASVAVSQVTQPVQSQQYLPIQQYMPTLPVQYFPQQQTTPQQHPVLPQQPVQQQPVQQQQPVLQQPPVPQQLLSPLQPPQQYLPQQFLPQQYLLQQYAMPQYPLQQPQPQQYLPQQYTPPQQYAPIPQQPQSTAALENIAAQMANLAMTLSRNQGTIQAEVADLRNAPAGRHVPRESEAPALKPADVATFEPKNQSDSDAASRFIDSIRDAICHYGEARTRVVLQRCCKGPAAEDWVAGMSDDDRMLLCTNCRHWIDMLERDFIPYLASRLSAA